MSESKRGGKKFKNVSIRKHFELVTTDNQDIQYSNLKWLPPEHVVEIQNTG